MDMAKWLRDAGFERYEPLFAEHAIDADVLAELKEAARLIRGTLLDTVAGGGSAEGAVDAGGDAGLGNRRGGGEDGGEQQESRVDPRDSHEISRMRCRTDMQS